MAKSSAGLLVYRLTGERLEVLLVHPGGPFFKKRDEGSWSIPKGELALGEEALAAARRELTEETGFVSEGPYQPLGGVVQGMEDRLHPDSEPERGGGPSRKCLLRITQDRARSPRCRCCWRSTHGM